MQDNASYNPNVSITQAAHLAGVNRTTINRNVKAGKLSKTADGFIQISELIRVYGPLKNQPIDIEVEQGFADAANADDRRGALKRQVQAPPKWIEEQAKSMGNVVVEMSAQLAAKDKVIERLSETALENQKVMLDHIDKITTRLLPPPAEPIKRKRWWHW